MLHINFYVSVWIEFGENMLNYLLLLTLHSVFSVECESLSADRKFFTASSEKEKGRKREKETYR